MTFFQYLDNNPFSGIIFSIVFFQLIHSMSKLVIRWLNVTMNGWPPVHLDADGDSVEVMLKKEQNNEF